MIPNLTRMLTTLDVTEPQTSGRLQVFGLRSNWQRKPTYVTLDEALRSETLLVTEMSEGGTVSTLKVTNHGPQRVFLMAGEHLIGAKQNRVLNASVLIDAKSSASIPVSCVEAGRWRYQSKSFSSPGTMAHGALRKIMSPHTKGGYETQGMACSNQGAVWSEVARKLGSLGSCSPSQALHQAYEDHASKLESITTRLPVPRDCSGVAFAVYGQIVGTDWFDCSETLQKLWPKLVRAYALDALEQAGVAERQVSPETLRSWLHTAAKAEARAFKSPGLGLDVRLEGPALVGASLVVEDQPIHLELFTQD